MIYPRKIMKWPMSQIIQSVSIPITLMCKITKRWIRWISALLQKKWETNLSNLSSPYKMKLILYVVNGVRYRIVVTKWNQRYNPCKNNNLTIIALKLTLYRLKKLNYCKIINALIFIKDKKIAFLKRNQICKSYFWKRWLS